MVNKKPKIAFVTPSLGTGGREKVLSQLINYFAKRNELEVHLILYAKKREILFELNESVYIHEPGFDFFKFPKYIGIIKTLLFLRKSLNKLKIDTLVSFEEKWNRFVLLASIGMDKRIFLSNRNHPYRDYGFIDRQLAKYLYPKAEALIAQTHVAKEIYEKRYSLKKCVVIGNPIRKIEVPLNNERENIVVSVGRLMTTKYHDRLIRIFSDINKPTWRLIIIGGDFANQNNRIKLNKQILQLGLENKVILTGYKKDVNSYLLRGKIFAFTSDREGFPNAIGEAMAAELPVVSYDCLAGPSDMIDDGVNGYLVSTFDDQAFKEKLLLLMNNDGLRELMGKRAKEKMSIFESDKICNKFYKLIIN